MGKIYISPLNLLKMKLKFMLQDVSFVLPGGRRLALVGPTGGGKTTLISLLFRFYHPQRGQIFLDGVDIQTLPLASLRRRLGLVLQDIVLFPGTILENLRLGHQDISETTVTRALSLVG